MEYLKKSFSVFMHFSEENQNRIFGKKGKPKVKLCPLCKGNLVFDDTNHAWCSCCAWSGLLSDLNCD